MNPGEAYWLSTPLPGRASGGRHSSVVLSCKAYNDRTGMPILAAMRHGTPSAYLVGVDPVDFKSQPGQPGLDAQRVIGLDQLSARRSAELSQAHGTVDAARVAQALKLVPRQFQLWQTTHTHRGAIWTVRGKKAPFDRVVLLLNDKAAANQFMKQVIALPYNGAVQESPLHMVAKADLDKQEGILPPSEQEALDLLIAGIFDLPLPKKKRK